MRARNQSEPVAATEVRAADQRYDTLTHLQKPGNPNAFWEIAVPNGTYTVRIVAGDAGHFDSVFRLNIEGVAIVSGTPTSWTRWLEGTSTVTVSDGRLTVTNGAGASNNKICFLEISDPRRSEGGCCHPSHESETAGCNRWHRVVVAENRTLGEGT